MLKVHDILRVSVVVLILWCCDAVNHEYIKEESCKCPILSSVVRDNTFLSLTSEYDDTALEPIHWLFEAVLQSWTPALVVRQGYPMLWSCSGNAFNCGLAWQLYRLYSLLFKLQYLFFSSCQCWVREQHTSEVKRAFTKPAVPAQWNVQWISPQVSDESDMKRSLITFPTIFIYFTVDWSFSLHIRNLYVVLKLFKTGKLHLAMFITISK